MLALILIHVSACLFRLHVDSLGEFFVVYRKYVCGRRAPCIGMHGEMLRGCAMRQPGEMLLVS
jgi:hypothetical protein